VLATADLALLGLAGGVMWLVARQVRALVQGRATGAGA
jgi:hypothetical protein